jgi:acyl-coenzyme A synthetase/AMP-(fatty) acid ligase
VNWAVATFQPSATDRLSSHAPFYFDLSILDLYVAFTAGAAVVLVPEELGKRPQELAAYIADRKISIWYSVPSILTLLARYGRLEKRDFSALRTVLFAGEVFPVRHLRSLKQLWPGPTYWNLYGPTETNVCTFYRIPEVISPDRTKPFPIGRACGNVEASVLDEAKRPVGGAEEGVLHIHASGPVMRGYWELPELTSAAFHVDASGRKWYCTGDVVSVDEAGEFAFLGRRDRMVKRRGYRIELGEIEAGLYRHPQVCEAAAVAVTSDDDVVITVFVAPEHGEKLSIIALKQYCAQDLPGYMNPDRFVFLERLPRTANEKVDYQKLTKEPT